MQATVYNLAGEQVGNIDLDDAVFGITPNMAVVHQAVLRQQANARQGTHETKTRAFVRGGGRKPWRQKGTGRARQGSTRSPQWRHGGVVFGPHARSYEQDMPRKMRRLAIRSVLSSKAADGHIVIVDDFGEMEPRTKSMIEVLNSLNIGKESALVFTTGTEDNLRKASGNIPNVTTMSAHLLSIVDMLKHTYIVMPRTALDVVHGVLSNNGGRAKLPLRESTWDGTTTYQPTETPAAAASTSTETEAATEPEAEATPSKSKRASSRRGAAASAAETAEVEPATEDVQFAPSEVQQSTAAATTSEVAEGAGSDVEPEAPIAEDADAVPAENTEAENTETEGEA